MRVGLAALLALTTACTSSLSGTGAGSSSGTASGSSGATGSSGGGSSGAAGSDGGVAADGGGCTGTQAYFAEQSWPQVFSVCVRCHVAGGESDGTRFVLKPDTIPDYLSQNMAIVREASLLMAGNQPLLVVKAQGLLAHGGGVQLPPNSPQLAILQQTLDQLANPVVCPGDPPRPVFEGVTLLDEYGTLRKAAIALAGRPPTTDEIATVDSGGLAALGGVLDSMMQEDAFYERLREVFSDFFLTDGFRANNTKTNSGNIISGEYHPDVVNHWGGEDWNWRSWPRGEGIRLLEGLAREPVEFVVEAVKGDRPLAEILTAPHRLLNAYTARFFSVDYKGFAPGTPFDQIPNPQEYQAAEHLPGVNEVGGTGEYAGILTTSAWLLRYPSSPTNFNRKRSRFTYKYFLDFDIMKTAPRIDASAVDLNDYPTRRNMQCTGCHAQIDPLAGAYQNWDECGYEAVTYYRTADKHGECNNASGWVIEDHMFAPGVGPGAVNEIAPADRGHALELLAGHIVTQRSFARSMAAIVYSGLLNRPLLAAPTDPSIPGYAALDAAFSAEQEELNRLATVLESNGLRLRPVVKEIVSSPAFRAANADVPDRQELLGIGGGTLSTSEVLDRKIQAITGIRWRRHLSAVADDTGYQRLGRHDGSQDAYLAQREELKTLYGGLDGSFDGVKVRQRLPSTLTAAIVEHMALEVSCEATARDFDMPAAQRKLFPLVDLTQVPSGNISDASEAMIVANIQYLHERVLGERLVVDDPEIAASYQLLSDVRTAGLQEISAGTSSVDLERPCANDMDLSTGQLQPGGTTQDPQYVVRAWQAVVAYMLMDYAFVFEP